MTDPGPAVLEEIAERHAAHWEHGWHNSSDDPREGVALREAFKAALRELLATPPQPPAAGEGIREQLRALVSRWRTLADDLRAAPDGGLLAVRDASRLRICADQLDAVLAALEDRR